MQGEVVDLGRAVGADQRVQQPRLHRLAHDRHTVATTYDMRWWRDGRDSDEFGERDIERVGHGVEGLKGGVAAPCLKLGERCSGDARAAGELDHRQPTDATQSTQVRRQRCFVGVTHMANIIAIMPTLLGGRRPLARRDGREEEAMVVSRLQHIPGIGVNVIGDQADAVADPEMLRLENLDTDLRPPAVALETTRRAIDSDQANSYLPFEGHRDLRAAAARHVERLSGRGYDPDRECVSVAGGLNGVLNTLLAVTEPGSEVVLSDPIYAGLINRIRLAGAVPRHVRAIPTDDGWHTDPAELASAVGPRTAAILLMSPAMPTGAVFDHTHLNALADPVQRHGVWVIYDAAMERIRFDERPSVHPASHPGLADRVITIGSASKELRMIGWRVGWVVAPAPIMADIALVGMTNVVCQVGIAQQAVAAALSAPDADADVTAATRVWQQRCDVILDQLADYPIIRPHGGWSLLLDTEAVGLTPAEASRRLFEQGRIAATPMNGWGPSSDRYLRLV
ncbi:MAG: pyridoxal phosphate-dependent aminotransferase, partial [Solirubrobacteraceae bacterium]